ncbi:MAG: hypothetical protein PHW73_10375 [Atribacterota bacterium]|nr:hypothetical protein [Atribacterota bacterium]
MTNIKKGWDDSEIEDLCLNPAETQKGLDEWSKIFQSQLDMLANIGTFEWVK